MGEKMTVKEVQQKTVELEKRLEGVEGKVDKLGSEFKDLKQNDIRELKENMQKLLSFVGEILNQRQSCVEENPREEKAELGSESVLDGFKMQFPSFNGKEYRVWRDRREQFFVLEEVAEDHKLKMPLTTMEESFDELIAKVAVDEQTALSCFLGGLKSPLEKVLRLQKPKNVNEAMGMARSQEDLLIELSMPCNTVRFNRTHIKVLGIKEYSSIFVTVCVSFWYSKSIHPATQMTPFEALYGYKPTLCNLYVAGQSWVETVNLFERSRETIFKILQDNLRVAQERIKSQAYRRRTEREFQVGDGVNLKLQAYKQVTIPNRRFHKLAAIYYGSFAILATCLSLHKFQQQLPDATSLCNFKVP